jgi:hypothetical protein
MTEQFKDIAAELYKLRRSLCPTIRNYRYLSAGLIIFVIRVWLFRLTARIAGYFLPTQDNWTWPARAPIKTPDPGVYNQRLSSQCAKRYGTLADRAGQRRIGLSRDRRGVCRRQLDRLCDLVADFVKGLWQTN